jgi:hypothetical protein
MKRSCNRGRSLCADDFRRSFRIDLTVVGDSKAGGASVRSITTAAESLNG